MPSTETAINGSRPDAPVMPGAVPAAFTQSPPPAPGHPADPAPVGVKPAKVKSRRKTATLLVVLAWLAATSFAGQGAWEFFSVDLGLSKFLPSLFAGFALFEIAQVACAVMARGRRIDDVDSRWGGAPGVAVWVFAALSGLLSASHETHLAPQLARFVAPIISAFLLDLLFSVEQGDARQRAGKKRKRINFKLSPERLLVRLGLADASDRSAEEAARDKAIAKVATLCHRAQLAKAELERGQKRAERTCRRAERAYRRALEAANERFGVAKDPRLMTQLQTSIALLDGAMSMTSREAIAASVNPWVGRRPSTSSARPATSGGERTTSRVSARPDDNRARLSPEQRLEQYDQVVAAHPGLTQEQYAAAIGIKPRQLRAVLSNAGRTPATATE